MPRHTLLATVACFALAASGCETSLPAGNPYDPDVPAHEREPGRLAGRIVPALEVDLEQAAVRVPTAGKIVVPDSQGNFEIPDLTPGVHELRVEAPRHSVWRQTGFYVDTGTRVDLGEIRLVAARGALSGAVKLEKIPGVPLDTHGGVLVTALPADEPGRLAAGESGKSVSSNPDGSWIIEGLLVGEYAVQGSHAEFFNWDTLTVKVTEDDVTPVSEIVMRSISGVIEIDGGAAFTSSEEVTLRVLAFEADEMKLSEDPDLAGAEWQTFAVEQSWTLGGEDGPAAVYARFRNHDGFVTPVVSDGIVLDREPPSDARVLIAEGAASVTQRQVSLDLLAADALSGVADMRIALDGDITDEPWVDFSAQQLVELPLGQDEVPDGLERTVYAQFRDGAGNQSDVVADTVVLDSTAPQNPTLMIDGGAALTASRNVTLTLGAEGATRMIVSNDAGLAGAEWMPYAPSLGWVLTAAEEQKTVYAQFADDAGNQSPIVEDGIELNTRGGISGVFLLEGAGANGNAGITVELSSDPVRTETTDALGAFAFADVPVGVFSLTASLEGFDPMLVAYVPVDPGQTTDVGTEILPVSRGNLRGTARREGAEVDEHGGIFVEIVGEDFSVVTNPTGDWTLRSIPVGQYALRATAEGYGAAMATDVEVAANEERIVDPMVLPADPGSVSGSVALEGQASPDLGGVEILVAGHSALTGNDGSFTVTAVPAGVYTLTARSAGYGAVQTVVVVGAGEQTDVGVLSLSIARGAISGSATLAGATDNSGITVEVDGTGFAGTTGSAGLYRIEGIPVGAYSLTARKDGYVAKAVGSVTVEEDQTVLAPPAELVRQRGDFVIEERVSGDQEYLDDPAVTLVFLELPQDAAEILVSEDAGFAGATWAAFSGTEHDYDLQGADGTATVFAKFKDTLDQESAVFSSTAVLDRAPPLAGSSVLIDNGAEWAVNPDVSLTLTGLDATSGVELITISTDGVFDDETDQAYVTSTLVRVDDAADGLKTVWVQFVDRAGNRSAAPAEDSIYLDRAGPVNPTVTIDSGDAFTTDPLVTLALSAEDACTADYPGGGCVTGLAEPAQMMIANDSGFASAAWEPYAEERAWFLKPGDGDKTVFVKFRDGAGNETATFASDDIALDRTPPGGLGIALAELAPDPLLGNGYTNNPDVEVTVTAAEATEMCVYGDLAGTPACTWVPYSGAARRLTLATAEDGMKTLYARFRDDAGNEAGPVFAQIHYDGTPPDSASLLIEGGASHVPTAGVELSLTAADASSGIVQMRIADGVAAGGAWEPYANSRLWGLPADDGPKQVTAEFRDRAGNTLATTAGVTLDATPPAPVTLAVSGNGGEPLGFSRDGTVDLTLTADDALDPDNLGYCVANDVSFSGGTCGVLGAGPPPLTLNGWNLVAGDGVRPVYARVWDRAGNEVVASGAIVVDSRPPESGVLSAEENDSRPDNGYTNDRNLTLRLAAAGATQYCVSGDIEGAGLCGNPDDAGWHDLVDTIGVTLTDVQGEHSILVEMRDPARNTIPMGAVGVVYDNVAPNTCELSINGTTYDLNDQPQNDEALTLLEDVDLLVNPADATSPITDFQVSNDGMFGDAVWRPYPPLNVDGWRLSPAAGNGEARVVWLKCRDAADNTATSQDAIDLDNTPPSAPGVVIDGGAEYTTDIGVELQLSSEPAGTAYARYSVDPVAWPPWEAYPVAGTPTLDLMGPEGLNTAYAMYRDKAGNLSAVASDTIWLDLTDPQPPGMLVTPGLDDGGTYYTDTLTPTVSWDASVSPDVDHYLVSINGADFQTPSLSFGAPALTEASHSWSVRAVDAAGRESTAINGDSFVCDVTPPTAPQFAEPADRIVDAPDFNVTLAVESTEANLARYETRSTASPSWTDRGAATSYMLTLTQNAENRLRVRAVDRAGNASDEDFLDVIEDSTPPDAPTLLTADQVVNADIFNVFLDPTSTSHLDPNFSHYELRGGQLGDWTPTASTDQFAFGLRQGDGVDCGGSVSCANLLELRAVDAADNVSGVASVTIAEDSVPPPAPQLTPEHGIVRGGLAHLFLNDPPPADPFEEPNFDHYEVKGGTLDDFVPVCPEQTPLCRPPSGLVGESDRFVYHDADQDQTALPTEIVGFSFALEPNQTNSLAVRAVDLAGNVSFPNEAEIQDLSKIRLTTGPATREVPTIHGDRIAFVENTESGSELVIVNRGADGQFGTLDDAELKIPIDTMWQANPAVHRDRVAWTHQDGGTLGVWVRNAGPDRHFGTPDDGPPAACGGCGGPDVRITPVGRDSEAPRISDGRIVYQESNGGNLNDIVLVEPGACGGYCASGSNNELRLTDDVNDDITPDIFGDTVVFLRRGTTDCELWVVQAGADDDFFTAGDNHREMLRDDVACNGRPRVFAPLDASTPANGNTILFGRGGSTGGMSLHALVPGDGDPSLFEAADTEIAFPDADWENSWDVHAGRIVSGQHSGGRIALWEAGADRAFGSADDAYEYRDEYYGVFRQVALYNDQLVYRSHEYGYYDIMLEELSSTRWISSSHRDDLLPTISGAGAGYVSTSGGGLNLLELDGYRLVNSGDGSPPMWSDNHPVLSGNRFAAAIHTVHVWEPGGDDKLGTADDSWTEVNPGGHLYLGAQVRYSIGSDSLSLDLDDDVAAWLDDSPQEIHVGWAGADGIWGSGGDDCETAVTGWVNQPHPRVGGDRLVWDQDGSIWIREPGPGGLCSAGDDVITDVTTPLGVSLDSVDFPDIDGERVVFHATAVGVHRIYLLEPGPDGLFSGTGDNRLTELTHSPFEIQNPIISQSWVAWLDERGPTREIYLLYIPDRGEQNITRFPFGRTQFDMWNGRVVWSDLMLGAFDIWYYSP